MAPVRRLPSWLLIVATAAICVVALQLELADLFPAWRMALQWTPAALPSTAAVPAVEIMTGLPTLSLTLDDADLYDPASGIVANKTQHGEEWERPGSVSYFDGGRLLFASGVGVRIHGGGSRITSPRQGFRLYFRRRYGARAFAPGILFGPDADPLQHLIVHNDVRRDRDRTYWHLINPLAYDIAAAMGAVTPGTKPVRFFLNGALYGVYVLTERFDQQYFSAHWNTDEVLVSQPAFDELWNWVRQTRPLTMEAVAKRVDIDSLTRWLLAVSFADTHDAYQGPGQFLDQRRSEAGWFWVNWDMDLSFREWDHDTYQDLLDRIAEGRRGRNSAEPRADLLTYLIADDAHYRDYYRRVFQKVMNHHVTEAFLAERYQHYLTVATQLKVEHLDYLPRLRQFLERRPAFYREITEQWLNAPASQPLELIAPADAAVLIDGERVAGGYRGRYFPDFDIVLDVPAEHRERFSGWLIDGRPAGREPRLSIRAEAPTRVEAIFGNRPAALAATVSVESKRAESSIPPALPDLKWRRIPAGTFWMGCGASDQNCGSDNPPRQSVTLAAPYDMLDREVSAGAFAAFAATTGSPMPRQPSWYADETHPVVNVTWDEAQAFCAQSGGALPSEAQWERAARGTLEGALFPWGNEYRGEANAVGRRPPDRWVFTAPVGSFEPNGFGLYDMAGNVWEWTADLYGPTGEDGYEMRTIRGGSWESNPARLRASYRVGVSRRGRHNLYVGFRCVRPAR